MHSRLLVFQGGSPYIPAMVLVRLTSQWDCFCMQRRLLPKYTCHSSCEADSSVELFLNAEETTCTEYQNGNTESNISLKFGIVLIGLGLHLRMYP
jgi:hypothetical protein